MDAKPHLLYFDIRGRAEPIRMVLFFVGIEFDDQQVTLDEWETIRSTTPFGRMPVYREGELQIAESYAIMNYLGRKHDLLGKTEADRIRCDVTTEAWRDYGNRVANAFGALSNSTDARKRFVADEQPALLNDLEANYQKRCGSSQYWAGDSPTIADFTAFNLIEGFARQFPDTLKKFDLLESFLHFFSSQPKIKEYLESPQRPAALFYGPHGKIYPQN